MMHIKFDRGLGVNAIRRLVPVLRNNEFLPELSGILLETSADGVTVTATARNEWMGAEIQFPALVLEPGSTVINGALFSKVLDLFGEEYAELRTVGRDNVWLSSGKIEYTLATLPVNNYPRPTFPQIDAAFAVAGLPQLLRRCLFTVGHDPQRPAYSRIKIDTRGTKLLLSATDTCGLTMTAASIDIKTPLHILLPSETAQYLTTAFEAKENIWVSALNKVAVFQIDGFRVCCLLGSENYMDVSTLLKTYIAQAVAVIKAKEMMRALDTLSSAAISGDVVQLQICHETIVFSSKGIERAVRTQCPAQSTTPMPEGRYYLGRYLFKALSHLGEGAIQLSVSGNGMLRLQTPVQVFLLVPTRPIDVTLNEKKNKKSRTKKAA